jgi:hypothetical protein
LVRAIRQSGLRVEYRGWSAGRKGERPMGTHPFSRDPQPGELAGRGAPTVAHLIPEHLPNVRKAIRRGPLVSHTVWETDLLPGHWPALLNTVDRVIVPTEWNREVFVASGVTKPVVVVPHVVCDPVPGDGGVPLALPADVVVFYTIARWDQRKAPAEVIRAFLHAFTAADPVALVVKTTPLAQYPAPGRWGQSSQLSGTTMLEIARIMRDYPRPALVRVEIEDWTPSQIAGLHTRGDCYVSLSHGEGWGIGAFDAAAHGNPVVMTGWGGQLAFLDANTSFLVDYKLSSVRHWEPRSYGPDQHWAIPSTDDAVEIMRGIAADLGAARRRAAPLRAKVLHDFAPSRVVDTLLDVVPELAAAVSTAPPSRPQRARDVAPTLRRRSRADDLLLVGVTVGPWRAAFDNWIEMAERNGFRYELLGREIAEPYIAGATKLRCLRDFFADQPRSRLVFHLDASDGFVCDEPTSTLGRYESYGLPLVMSAEQGPRALPFDVPDPTWRWACAGAYVGEAGVVADALREGYEMVNWAKYGEVSDQWAMIRYLHRHGNEHLGTVDYRRTIIKNIEASTNHAEFEAHREWLDGHHTGSLTSAVHFFGNNGRGYNSFAHLYGLTPEDLDGLGRFRAPHRPRPAPRSAGAPITARQPMPRIAHFVFGLRPEPEPFHLVHYLAIASCLEVVQPDEVHVHCHHMPYGPYWDLVEPRVVIHRVEPARPVSELTYDDPVVARYSYAHHADFVRLDVLAEHGGLYADIDTLFVSHLPERLWRAPFVIGREADVPNGEDVARPALSNALLMSQPGSMFVETWRAEIAGALDGTWANHSCFLANDLAARFASDVHVEPRRTFHAFEPTPAGIALLLEHPAQDLEGVVSLHLAAHLWWDEDRLDFSAVHAGMIDEEWICTSNTTYAVAARRFLPNVEGDDR